jgi:hypothetical protein
MKPSEYHACATGDCPHETQAECTAALLALADEQAAEIDRLQTALDDVQAARRRADDVVADQHIEIERLKATHSRLNEADVMVWVLRDFGYCTGLRGVWIPHHCFGDTEITVTGLEWEITSKPYHKAGFGFHALMVAMAECRVQPFKWSDEAAQAEDSPEDQDAIGARIDALVAGGELDGDELPEVAYGKEGVMTRDIALWLQGQVTAIGRLLAAVEETAKCHKTDAVKHLTEARFACTCAESVLREAAKAAERQGE